MKSERLLEYSKIDIVFEAETAEKQAVQEKKAKAKMSWSFAWIAANGLWLWSASC